MIARNFREPPLINLYPMRVPPPSVGAPIVETYGECKKDADQP